MADVKAMLNAQMVDQLKQLAVMAYGHNSTEAGSGRIGMIGEKVVKFNTHIGERFARGGSMADMQRSCDALRAHLGGLARKMYVDGFSTGMSKVLKELGLNPNGDILCGGKCLLNRKVVAKFIEQVKQDSNTAELRGVRGGARLAESKFSQVRDDVVSENVQPDMKDFFGLLTDEALKAAASSIALSDDDKNQVSEAIPNELLRMKDNINYILFGGFKKVCASVMAGKLTSRKAHEMLDCKVAGYVAQKQSKDNSPSAFILKAAQTLLNSQLTKWFVQHEENLKQGHVAAFSGVIGDETNLAGRINSAKSRGDPPSLLNLYRLEIEVLHSSDRLARAVLDGRMDPDKAVEAFKADCEAASFEKKARGLLQKACREADCKINDFEEKFDDYLDVFYKKVGARLAECAGVRSELLQGRVDDMLLTAEGRALIKNELLKLGGAVTFQQTSHVNRALQLAKDELDKIMNMPDVGSGKQLANDVMRGVLYSFNGTKVIVPESLRKSKSEGRDKFMDDFKKKALEFFGNNEKLMKFYVNFAHQGCLSVHGELKRELAESGGAGELKDDLVKCNFAGSLKSESSVDVTKINDNKYCLTASIKFSGMQGVFIIPDDGTAPVLRQFDEQSNDNWYGYTYSLVITVGKDGNLELSMPQAPVEKICIMHEPGDVSE